MSIGYMVNPVKAYEVYYIDHANRIGPDIWWVDVTLWVTVYVYSPTNIAYHYSYSYDRYLEFFGYFSGFSWTITDTGTQYTAKLNGEVHFFFFINFDFEFENWVKFDESTDTFTDGGYVYGL